jgi:hypothetical protein
MKSILDELVKKDEEVLKRDEYFAKVREKGADIKSRLREQLDALQWKEFETILKYMREHMHGQEKCAGLKRFLEDFKGLDKFGDSLFEEDFGGTIPELKEVLDRRLIKWGLKKEEKCRK